MGNIVYERSNNDLARVLDALTTALGEGFIPAMQYEQGKKEKKRADEIENERLDLDKKKFEMMLEQFRNNVERQQRADEYSRYYKPDAPSLDQMIYEAIYGNDQAELDRLLKIKGEIASLGKVEKPRFGNPETVGEYQRNIERDVADITERAGKQNRAQYETETPEHFRRTTGGGYGDWFKTSPNVVGADTSGVIAPYINEYLETRGKDEQFNYLLEYLRDKYGEHNVPGSKPTEVPQLPAMSTRGKAVFGPPKFLGGTGGSPGTPSNGMAPSVYSEALRLAEGASDFNTLRPEEQEQLIQRIMIALFRKQGLTEVK